MLETINDYIKVDLTHSLHTSESKSFRGCRRRWNWLFRNYLYPKTTVKPLEFGSAYHKGCEVLYSPKLWDTDEETVISLAKTAFAEMCQEQKEKYEEEYGHDPEVDADYKERVELGNGMLDYFAKHSRRVDKAAGFTPTYVEVSFELPIEGPNGEQLWCKCDNCWARYVAYARTLYPDLAYSRIHQEWKGLPVTYGGRLDAILEGPDGRIWIVDWKELQVEEPILTPTGWIPIGKLQDGDFVIGRDGQPTRIIGCSPVTQQEVWEVEWNDGTIIECSADHKWSVYTHSNRRNPIVRTTKQLATGSYYETYATPINNCVEFTSSEELPMHPYVLGALLGDGHFKRYIQFASKSGETVELLKQYADTNTVIEDCRRYGGNQWNIKGPWREQLEELNLWGKLSGEKFIPESYLFASVKDRTLLLQGLYDTDGLASTMRICTTSSQLAQDTANLIRSLGGKASISNSKERVHSNGKTANKAEYFINFWVPETISFCQLERKKQAPRRNKGTHRRSIKEVRKTNRTADMRCIAVESPEQLYITRDFIVTHNTARTLSTDREEFLLLDDQISRYCWALWRLGWRVAGFIYHEQKKGFPQEPEPLNRRYKGMLFSTNKQQDVEFDQYRNTVKELDPEAFEEGLYNPYLEYLQENPSRFSARYMIYRSEIELEQVGITIYDEACDMVDPALKIYPNAGRFNCTSCAFRQPCLGMNMGEDYQYTLDTMFDKRQYHYWRIKKPSTESKGNE